MRILGRLLLALITVTSGVLILQWSALATSPDASPANCARNVADHHIMLAVQGLSPGERGHISGQLNQARIDCSQSLGLTSRNTNGAPSPASTTTAVSSPSEATASVIPPSPSEATASVIPPSPSEATASVIPPSPSEASPSVTSASFDCPDITTPGSLTSVDHASAAANAQNVADHHTMLAPSNFSNGAQAHVQCQLQQAQNDYSASSKTAPVWEVIYWTNSNKGKTFGWTLPDKSQLKRMVVAPYNAKTAISSPDQCVQWGGMVPPGVAAKSALDAWIKAGKDHSTFEIWMRARDETKTIPMTPQLMKSQIKQFNNCVQKDCPDCINTKNSGNATGVLCILDKNSTNKCVVPPGQKSMTYGVMAGPHMMGTPDPKNSKAHNLAEVHFGEMYEKYYPNLCPSAGGHVYGAAVATYIGKMPQSRGASTPVPTLGGQGATCPIEPSDLPAVLAAMGSTYYSQVGLWSS
jgi:hypothetical protein